MPSVAQESPTAQSSRKRRRDDNDHQLPPFHSATNTPHGIFHQSSASANRKIIPLPPGKRQRTIVDIEVETDGEPMQRSPSNSPPRRHHHDHHHEHHHPHRDHQPARDALQVEDDTRSPSALPTPTAAPSMSRCHICSRNPKKKSDLDSFADCQGCGERTCYVCIRECLGWDGSSGGGGGGGGPSPYPYSHSPTTTTQPRTQPQSQAQPHSHPHPAPHHHGAPTLPSPAAATASTPIEGVSSLEEAGEISFTMLDADDEDQQAQQAQHEQGGWTTGGGHRRVVCSRCCVERGQDGEVVCLGCLPFVEG